MKHNNFYKDECMPHEPCEPMPKPCEPINKFPPFCPPPVKPYMCEGMTPIEAINKLGDKVNTCICTYNDVMANCYKSLHNMEEACKKNGAYYSKGEVWIEEGYNAEAGAKYFLIHKACIDKKGHPIRMELHLAYNNTTNSQIKQNIFSASKTEYADIMIPALPPVANGWYGRAILNGTPINTTENNSLYTVGFTKQGVMKVYSNTISIEQILRDTVENAMGCSGILVMNGQITDNSYQVNIPNKDIKQSRVFIGQNYDTREVLFLVCGNQNNVDESGLTSIGGAQILLNYGCDIVVELAEGESACATNKGSLLFVPDNNIVPETYAYWYISKKNYFCNDYQYELAELMQNYGQSIWQGFINASAIKAETDAREEADRELHEDLNTETDERVSADTELQENIDTETANRKEADTILQQNIENETNARIDADETLQANINAEATEREENDSKLSEAITNEATARDEADKDLQLNIDNEEQARINGDTNLQRQIDTEILARQNGDKTLSENLSTEARARAEADTALQEQISAEQTARVENYNNLQEQITAEQTARVEADNQKLSLSGGTMNGDINMNSHDITNLSQPVNASDAVRKDYVDAQIENEENLRITAVETLQANINAEATEREENDSKLSEDIANEATARAEADNKIRSDVNELLATEREATEALLDTKLDKSGGTMSGQLYMGYHKISSLLSPTEANDATNKMYVDNLFATGLTLKDVAENIANIQNTTYPTVWYVKNSPQQTPKGDGTADNPFNFEGVVEALKTATTNVKLIIKNGAFGIKNDFITDKRIYIEGEEIAQLTFGYGNPITKPTISAKSIIINNVTVYLVARNSTDTEPSVSVNCDLSISNCSIIFGSAGMKINNAIVSIDNCTLNKGTGLPTADSAVFNLSHCILFASNITNDNTNVSGAIATAGYCIIKTYNISYKTANTYFRSNIPTAEIEETCIINPISETEHNEIINNANTYLRTIFTAIYGYNNEHRPIYINNVNGSDENDGLTSTTPIKTQTKLQEILNNEANNFEIILLSDFRIGMTLNCSTNINIHSGNNLATTLTLGSPFAYITANSITFNDVTVNIQGSVSIDASVTITGESTALSGNNSLTVKNNKIVIRGCYIDRPNGVVLKANYCDIFLFDIMGEANTLVNGSFCTIKTGSLSELTITDEAFKSDIPNHDINDTFIINPTNNVTI